MKGRLGSLAAKIAVFTVGSAALLVLPVLLGGATPEQSAMMLGVLYAAIAAAWLAEFMYRKAFPNLFAKFEREREKERQNRTFVGDGDE